jgi:4-diphosphocytidyl-2-C-methyl-D-erythritol kinase
VTALAPAKINLVLRVGAPDSSGYHPLVTVFQALDLWDEVSVSKAPQDELVIRGSGNLSGVPTDTTNIVWRAVDNLAKYLDLHSGQREPLRITVDKRIPVAGGMAGGSADAAATLVALNDLWGAGVDARQLREVGKQLGADVPFSLLGGCALGQGRGDDLTVLAAPRPLHVVIVRSPFELSTPLVYATLDSLRAGRPAALPSGSQEAGIVTAPLEELSTRVVNDLQDAAIRLAPAVGDVLAAVSAAGSITARVSGSGPTVWGLCLDEAHAREVAQTLTEQGFDALPTRSTPLGAHLRTGFSSPTEAR